LLVDWHSFDDLQNVVALQDCRVGYLPYCVEGEQDSYQVGFKLELERNLLFGLLKERKNLMDMRPAVAKNVKLVTGGKSIRCEFMYLPNRKLIDSLNFDASWDGLRNRKELVFKSNFPFKLKLRSSSLSFISENHENSYYK